MKANYVVVGYVCMAILAVFGDSGYLLPRWVSALLWIGLAYAFTKLASQPETKVSKATAMKMAKSKGWPYLNSKRAPNTHTILGCTEISRNRCRASYQTITSWKEENPYESWDSPAAREVFHAFSTVLDAHLRDFSEERDHQEVQIWSRFAEEIRRNLN